MRIAPLHRLYLSTVDIAQQRLAGFQTAACMQLGCNESTSLVGLLRKKCIAHDGLWKCMLRHPHMTSNQAGHMFVQAERKVLISKVFLDKLPSRLPRRSQAPPTATVIAGQWQGGSSPIV